MIKWSPEAIIGALAVGISTTGGVVTTAVHWGVTNTQIAQVEQNQIAMSSKLDQHQQELSDQKTHEAEVEQKLNDMIDQLNRIEKKL